MTELGDFGFGKSTVEQVNVAGLNVDMFKQVLVHEPRNTLQLERLHRKVLGQIECHDIRERQLSCVV